MTESKNAKITLGNTHLARNTLLLLVIRHVFSLLPLGRYLLLLTTLKRYQPTIENSIEAPLFHLISCLVFELAFPI